MKRKMKCPMCGKRAFDIKPLPREQVEVELKCPNCRKVVRISCVKESCMDNGKGGDA